MHTFLTIMLMLALRSGAAITIPTTPPPVPHVGVVDAGNQCSADQIPVVADAPWIVDNDDGEISIERPPVWQCGPNTAH